MYNPIFAKSFNRYERRRFGFCAIFLCLIVALNISSTFKPCLNGLSLFGHYAANLELQYSINAVQDMLMVDDKVENYNQTVDINAADQDFQLPIYGAENMLLVNHTSLNISQPIVPATETKVAEPICRVSKAGGDYCEIEGDIRIQPNSSTIFVLSPNQTTSNPTNSWTIKPYPRKGIARVKNWTINLVRLQNQHMIKIPKCTQNHTNPAILFSVGGFSGNYFHDLADILFPLYSSTLHFQKDIHFLASDYKPWWINKFRQILEKLTKLQIMDIDREKQVHCFNKIIVGLKFHKELIKTPSGPSMNTFRHLLRKTFSLERKKSIRLRKSKTIKPRLMIISRKRTRILTNEDDVMSLAENLGYEVVLAEAGISSNVSRFAQTVNSCDVLIGVHGAGLTNMVFLPDNAVLIQMVPFGEIDEFARLDFGNPSRGMNLRYLEYKMSVKESSLSKEYPVDHPVLKDPKSYRRKGWGAIWSIYLEKQNVTVDLQRLKGTLVKAIKLLHH